MSRPRNDLFDNPMVRSAKAALSPEAQEEYKRIGESLYNTVDFERSVVYDDEKCDPAYDAAIESLKSGLHPSFLTPDEVALLQTYHGEDWYLHFGLSENDLK